MEQINWNQYIPSAQSFDPVAFGRMKADSVNATSGDLTGFDCPKCLNRGYVADVQEDGAMIVRDCDCMKIRRCIWRMEASGLKNVIREKTFDSFKDSEPWQTTIKNGAMAYADRPEGWLLFCGQSGSGKTHLAMSLPERVQWASCDGTELDFVGASTAAIQALGADRFHRGKHICHPH